MRIPLHLLLIVSLVLMPFLGLRASADGIAVSSAVSNNQALNDQPNTTPLLQDISLSIQPMPRPKLRRQVRKKYAPVEITIKSEHKNPVLIKSFIIESQAAPDVVYGQTKDSKSVTYLTSALTGLALAPFTFGITLVAGLFIVGPVSAVMVGHTNQKLKRELASYESRLPKDVLEQGDSLTIKVLLPVSISKPSVKLIVQDLKTSDMAVIE